MGGKGAALLHSQRFGVGFGEEGQRDWCQCKSSEQNRASKCQSCGSGLEDQCTALTGRKVKGLEEVLTVG